MAVICVVLAIAMALYGGYISRLLLQVFSLSLPLIMFIPILGCVSSAQGRPRGPDAAVGHSGVLCELRCRERAVADHVRGFEHGASCGICDVVTVICVQFGNCVCAVGVGINF